MLRDALWFSHGFDTTSEKSTQIFYADTFMSKYRLSLFHVGQNVGHLPHVGVLQNTHDPLNPVHGDTLLETAESWQEESCSMSHMNCVDSRAESVQQMGSVKCVCEGTDSLLLWPGSAGSHEVRPPEHGALFQRSS